VMSDITVSVSICKYREKNFIFFAKYYVTTIKKQRCREIYYQEPFAHRPPPSAPGRVNVFSSNFWINKHIQLCKNIFHLVSHIHYTIEELKWDTLIRVPFWFISGFSTTFWFISGGTTTFCGFIYWCFIITFGFKKNLITVIQNFK